jgi:hypothetical protein
VEKSPERARRFDNLLAKRADPCTFRDELGGAKQCLPQVNRGSGLAMVTAHDPHPVFEDLESLDAEDGT